MVKSNFSHLSVKRTFALLIHYFFGYLFLYQIIASKLTLTIHPTAKILLPSVQFGVYLFTSVVAIFLAWPVIKNSYFIFKKDIFQNIKFSIWMVLLILFFNIFLSLCVSLMTNTSQSANQSLIQEISVKLPLMTILSTCVFAPMIEESVFRCGVYSCLRKRYRFVFSAIVSSLMFGSIHIMDSLFSANFIDVSYVLVYAGIGLILAYGYEKSSSVMIPYFAHTLNNVIAIILMFI